MLMVLKLCWFVTCLGDAISRLEAVIESWWNLSGQEFFVRCASRGQMTSQIRFLGNNFSSEAYILQSAVLWHRAHCSLSFKLISIVDLLGTNHLFWFHSSYLTRVITRDCMNLYNTWFNSSLFNDHLEADTLNRWWKCPFESLSVLKFCISLWTWISQMFGGSLNEHVYTKS